MLPSVPTRTTDPQLCAERRKSAHHLRRFRSATTLLPTQRERKNCAQFSPIRRPNFQSRLGRPPFCRSARQDLRVSASPVSRLRVSASPVSRLPSPRLPVSSRRRFPFLRQAISVKIATVRNRSLPGKGSSTLATLFQRLNRKLQAWWKLNRFPDQALQAIDDVPAKIQAQIESQLFARYDQWRPEINIAPLTDPLDGKVFDYPERLNRIKYLVAQTLTSSVDYITATRIEGDIVEFGVGSGWTSAVLSRSMQHAARRRMHLFDSFEGLPVSASTVDQASPMVKSGIWGGGTCNWGITPEQLLRMLRNEFPSVDVEIYKGWFSDTMSRIPAGTKVAMAHIDCDLYQSTRDVIDHLLSNRMLSKGAILLFDDWTCNQCDPDMGQQRAWREAVETYGIKYMDYGFYSHAGKRFIYHGH
ncbi:MAG: hypothetical protein C0483_13935 [Pirellula sp.]|nr:hypothetical protein [Pirellula sp.]